MNLEQRDREETLGTIASLACDVVLLKQHVEALEKVLFDLASNASCYLLCAHDDNELALRASVAAAKTLLKGA